MIQDRENTVSINQAVTATAVSTDTIDLGTSSPARDIGAGEPIEVNVQVGTLFETANSATLQVQVITSANANLSSETVLLQTSALAASALTAGARILQAHIPAGVAQRYLGLRYVVGTGSFSAGTVTGGFNLDRPEHRAYASGLRVSGF